MNDWAVIGWTFGLVALGFLVYRPWQAVPFDITDFSEMLPLFSGSDTSLGRLDAVMSYYFGHGRSYVLTSAFIWIQWELFGLWAVGWRLFRVLLMALLIWTFLRTAIRFGVPLLPAALGASLFVIGWPASEGWLRLTGEPLAAVFLLAGLGIAAHYHLSASPLRTSLVLALLSAAMVLSKETTVVCMPLFLLVAASWRGEAGFRPPKLDQRTILVGVSLTIAALALGAFVFFISNRSGPEAYARVYGTAPLDLARFRFNILATLWPLGPPSKALSPLGALSSVIVLFGCLLAIRNNPKRTVGFGLIFLLLFCVFGAVVYLPWKRFEPHYAIPFLVGPAGLFAIGACGLMGRSKFRGGLVTGMFLLILLSPALDAFRESSVRAATRIVNWRLAQAIHDVPDAAVLVFAVPGLPDQPWQGRGPTLTRYADANFGGGSPLSSTDQSCSGVAGRLAEIPAKREIIVSYHHWCGALPGEKTTISREVRILIPGEMKVGTIRISADILIRDPPSQDSSPQPGR